VVNRLVRERLRLLPHEQNSDQLLTPSPGSSRPESSHRSSTGPTHSPTPPTACAASSRDTYEARSSSPWPEADQSAREPRRPRTVGRWSPAAGQPRPRAGTVPAPTRQRTVRAAATNRAETRRGGNERDV
jgi:hypothetical protein